MRAPTSAAICWPICPVWPVSRKARSPLTSAPVTQADIDQIMKPKRGDWPSYNGGLDGNRWSGLDQITTANVKSLQPQFVFAPGGSGLEGTPVVIDDVMYVTGGTRVCALNAKTGAPIWCTPRDNGIASTPKSAPAPVGPNRGVAVLGDRVFYISDDAYLVCLNRLTGAVMWSVWLPEKGAEGKFYSSMAPMVVGDQIVAGIAGGDSPMRGFLAAYHPDSGKLAWRFYTIPKPGEPLAKTWIGRALTTGGGATWSTGSYDAETGTLYWAVGNPYPDTDPDERGGRNLYTNSVIALDARTGTFKWHFQFTPYDTHDWDATQPLVLADANWNGKPRKLLLSAQRSGVFYVIDRTNGQFLLAKPFVKKETWTKGFEKDGTPIMVGRQHADGGRHHDLSRCARRHQLVRPVLRSPDRPVLCDGGRGLRHLSQDRQDLRAQSRSVRCRHAAGAGAEHRDRRRRLGEAVGRTAGDQLHRRADHGGRVCCSMARPAAISPRWMPRPGRPCGPSAPMTAGGPRP